jgi:hypothetical protein
MVGTWICQISSRMQGGRGELGVASENGAQATEEKTAEVAAAGGKDGVPRAATCRDGAGAVMPEATVCLLLDRFAPS